MNPISILLVEDNEGDILLIKDALSERKIINTLISKRDGEQAFEYLDKAIQKNDGHLLPDLILLDINLPKVNGHQLLERIKMNDSLKIIPVIILTTSSSNSDIQKAYSNYANCYITKPIDVNDFIDVVVAIESFWLNIAQLPKY